MKGVFHIVNVRIIYHSVSDLSESGDSAEPRFDCELPQLAQPEPSLPAPRPDQRWSTSGGSPDFRLQLFLLFASPISSQRRIPWLSSLSTPTEASNHIPSTSAIMTTPTASEMIPPVALPFVSDKAKKMIDLVCSNTTHYRQPSFEPASIRVISRQ